MNFNTLPFCRTGKNDLLFLTVHAFLPLFSGTLIYYLSRHINVLFFSKWFGEIATNAYVLPGWIKFNLPDFLWMYAFTSAFNFLWANNKTGYGFFWKSIIPFIAFGSELMQAIRIVPGTFDILDMAAYSLSLIFTTIIHQYSFQNLKTFN